QTRITTKWFKGKELAFALGINLSVSRLGTVLTDFLSPHLALEVSLPSAIWVGFVTCVISMISGIALNALDEYGLKELAHLESNDLEYASTSYEMLEAKNKKRKGSIIAPHSPILSASHHPKYEKRNSRISNGLASQEALLGRGLSPSYKDHSEHVHVPTFNELLDFSIPFWQIVLVMCLMFATVIPFNTIHAAFLQLKWYPGNPKK
ncbi:hypothetical protein HDU99_000423, partial [Rhizoclosmatium hyalinum]